MRLKLYNSATCRKEAIWDKKIGIYVCGITPYDTTHLGHAFTFLVYDVLVRYLRYLGKKVTYVQNVTDIDDDILLRAKSEGIGWRILGNQETRRFLLDMKNLNMLPFDHYVKATDHIKEMIEIIKRLILKGYAYISGGNVYFCVSKDPYFGQRVCRLNYEAMLAIANERGNFPNDPNKKDPLDFVLWQAKKTGEPSWESPWGKGRPGWHIECSAMSTKYLGQPFSIHGGGADLKFPHHEAEISQSEKAFSQPLALLWMHTGMVYCEGKKMSKSLGNMIFVRDLLLKFSPNAIRWYLLSHNWQKNWNYSLRELQSCAKSAAIFEETVLAGNTKKGGSLKLKEGFLKTMDNNLDTKVALEYLEKLAKKDSNLARELAEKILGLTFKINRA